MEEIEAIFWERNADITAFKNPEAKRNDLLAKERARVQRENWILKVIKTVKVFTLEQKKNIYDSVLRMMNYYTHSPNKEQLDDTQNFTQLLVNTFLRFYQECFSEGLATIKKIIRPNNAFIVVDLIKMLVDTHRHLFKVKMQENFQTPAEDRPRNKSFQTLPSKRELPIPTETSVAESACKEQQVVPSGLQHRISIAIHEKISSNLNASAWSEKDLVEKVNEMYLTLLERNQNIAFTMRKFSERCKGKPTTFSYKVKGLYTEEETKVLERKNQTLITEKFAGIQQLRGNPTAEQLKEYFKIKVEIQDVLDTVHKHKQNSTPVNWWLPIVLRRSINPHTPMLVLVSYQNKELVDAAEFIERTGMTLKSYLKQVLQSLQPSSSINYDLKEFRKHHYLDINRARTKELLQNQCRVYSKEKRESIFPMLKSIETKQQQQIYTRNRAHSEHKLAPLFKNELVRKKIDTDDGEVLTEPKSVEMPKHLDSKTLKVREQLRNPYQRNKSLSIAQRSRIDDIIQSIINQRNLNANSDRP